MTKDEVAKLLWMIAGSYDNFKLDNPKVKTDAWYFDLHEYNADEVLMGYKVFKTTKGSAFAPTPDEIIACMHVPEQLAMESKTEVWNAIRKAIGNSSYNSVEEYEKLPEVAKQIVRSPSQLQEWAGSEGFNENVVQSLVYRSYDDTVKNGSIYKALPTPAQERVVQLRQETIQQLEEHSQTPVLEVKLEEVVTPSECDYSKQLEERLWRQ